MVTNKKIGIWGFGIVGKAAYRYLLKQLCLLEILDAKPFTPEDIDLFSHNNTSHCDQNSLIDFLTRNDHIIPSPGIDLTPYAAFAHKWLSELDIFYTAYRKPIIAITGTIGKTSITHLTGQLLNRAGLQCAVGGNIGIGMLDLVQESSAMAARALLEVSSFQLELCKQFAPDLAIWTNFYPNHLDRHSSAQAYFDAKYNLLAQQTADQKALVPLSLMQEIYTRNTQSSCTFFSPHEPTAEQKKLLRKKDAVLYFTETDICIYHNGVTRTVIPRTALPAISYQENWLIICGILLLLEIPLSIIAEHASLTLPEHRLEKINANSFINFYNDSKSTTPQSTLAAVEQLQGKPIHLLLGGISKGIDRSSLIEHLIGKVTHIYCFGKEAEHLLELCKRYKIPAQKFTSLDEAFSAALSNARHHDQILFSPAGASFDLFANYMERGNYFKKLVGGLTSNRN